MSISALSEAETVVSDLFFPEGLRWHGGQLWYSDIFDRTVNRLGPAGPEVVARVQGMPSGLGWMPDGRLLVVSMIDRCLLAIGSNGQTSTYADLSGTFDQLANDMIVDSKGRAYVGNYGFDVDAGKAKASTHLVRVDPDGTIHLEEPHFVFPNGMALVDDEATLVVAETFADRISTCHVSSHGQLSAGAVLVELPEGSGPDGIAVDHSGLIWVPCAYGSKLLAVTREGKLAAEISGDGQGVNCCAVGGPDGQTLFVAQAPMDEDEAARNPAGRIVSLKL